YLPLFPAGTSNLPGPWLSLRLPAWQICEYFLTVFAVLPACWPGPAFFLFRHHLIFSALHRLFPFSFLRHRPGPLIRRPLIPLPFFQFLQWPVYVRFLPFVPGWPFVYPLLHYSLYYRRPLSGPPYW